MLVFDIETHSADERYDRDPEDFYRVGGALDETGYRTTTSAAEMREAVLRAPLSAGHNVIGFDLPALGVDVIEMTNRRQVVDTMILDATYDPPDFGMMPAQAMRMKYSLDKACERHGIPGKQGDLRALAREFTPPGGVLADGYGCIPTDDPRYLSYLCGDLGATAGLLHELVSEGVSDYAWREFRIAAVAAEMSSNGFALDRDLLAERLAEGRDKRAGLVEWLVTEFDIPTTLPNGKPAKSPQASKAGKAALVAAFATVGVTEDELPHTDKGAVSFAGEQLEELAESHPEAAELCDAIGALVGIRSVYETADKYMRSDGRVHPDVTFFQASGRASITKPGLTVFGKRGERKRERDIFVAAEGFVLLSADLSQVDARAVAAHSGDPAYIALFEPGRDSHEIIARMVWGDRVYESNPAYYRQAAKVIGHGTNYGMGVSKLALSAKVPEEESFRVVSTLREQFPGVEAWKSEVRAQAEAGEMLDNGFGRIMRPNPDRAWTQGPALMGQGTARDILMEGILRMPTDIQRMIRAVVHDEVVAECRAEDVEEVRHEIINAMSFEWCPPWKSDPVMFTADCSPAPGAATWSGCY